MIGLGLLLLVAASALLLSALQGWALRGRWRLARHLLAWGAGTVLVALPLAAAWRMAGRAPDAPVAATLLAWVAGTGVAAALVAGALHWRARARRARGPVREAWVARALAQGATLALCGAATLALLVVRRAP